MAGVAGDFIANWPTPMAGTPAQNGNSAAGNSAAGNSDFSRRTDQLAENLLSQMWPTATAKDADGARSFDLTGNRIRANAGPTLVDASQRWGTPRASDADKGGPNQSFGAGGTPLPAQAAQWTSPSATDANRGGTITEAMTGTTLVQQVNTIWPTPAARDYKGENGPDHLVNGSGRLHMDQLPNAVAYQFTPPAPETSRDGVLSFETGRILHRLLADAGLFERPARLRQAYCPPQRSPMRNPARWAWHIARRRMAWTARREAFWTRARLNPQFAEWLMGWPPGHSLCAPSAMEFTRWQLRMRGALSQPPMASGPWIWKPPAKTPPPPKQMNLFG